MVNNVIQTEKDLKKNFSKKIPGVQASPSDNLLWERILSGKRIAMV